MIQPSPSHSKYHSRMQRPTVTQDCNQDPSHPGDSSKKSFSSISTASKQSSVPRKIFCHVNSAKGKHCQISSGGFFVLKHKLWRFLHLKAQALEVSDDQVITQAIKELHAGYLHSYLVREHLKTLEESYDNFQKFSRSEVLHFRKLDQQSKVPKGSEGSRPTKYNKSRGSIMNFDTSQKQIHSISSDRCGPPENWEKNLDLRSRKVERGLSTLKEIIKTPEVVT
jgi:hypothetical protein